MSEELKDGGPAFLGDGWAIDGMQVIRGGGLTVRDWFAGQALAGIVANHEFMRGCENAYGGKQTLEAVAVLAFAHSDAMLVERAKPGEQRDKPAEGEASK